MLFALHPPLARRTLAGRPLLAALALLWGIASHAATEQDLPSTAVLFQGFHWQSAATAWYPDLAAKAADLKALGITHVWFPPPSDSASAEGYLPRRLNLLDSAYGTEAQLRAATAAMAAQGLHSVADIVVNHRVGTRDWGDFTQPKWGCDTVVAGDEWAGACGGADSGDSYAAGRDLDHGKPQVQADLQAWLSQRLRGAGFSGLRFDYAKGYAPAYAALYHDAMAPDFCVGEIWTTLNLKQVDAHRQQLVDYVDGTGGRCAAFDFTTKGLLNQALSTAQYQRLRDTSGQPAGGIGWWPQKMVSFVDNHDTGPSTACNQGQNLWPVPCGKILPAYAYILTHPGIPTVYYPHVYDFGLRDAIAALIKVRLDQGLNSSSSVAIQRAEKNLYAALVDGKVAVKLGSKTWSPGTGWTLAAKGTQYAVWVRSS
ncbi:MAG TPA: alpha-amylase C-terminal beta-sheet domain-containing protein [Ideonella sp.]|nr:alpha-amylase C-terminal beta-sheet domain-containing protein [Ideonella sp.]